MAVSDWDAYSAHLQGENCFEAEPVQQMRVDAVCDRLVGTVLDVGGGDGYPASQYAKTHDTVMVEISSARVHRARNIGVDARIGDAEHLTVATNSFDTVVLGEILEHLTNPGLAIAEAFRVARERVIMTLPLYGWADPTHQWRISLDVCVDENQRELEKTKGAQIVVTWQRGECWPPEYADTDPSWSQQFGA